MCKNSALIPIPKEDLNISIRCSKVEIKNISVWNFANDKRGKWFDVTSNVIAGFPVDATFIVSKYLLHCFLKIIFL